MRYAKVIRLLRVCGFICLGLVLSAIVFAMDSQLYSLPKLSKSSVVWQDRTLEVNGISAAATHLRSSMPIEEILGFYKNALAVGKWELKDYYASANLLAFAKKNKFFYVGVVDNGNILPRDVYLVDSPANLAICKTLKDYFLQEEIAGDAPGRDLSGIPRYPGAKRRLSVFTPLEGAVLIYEVEAGPQEVSGFYRQNLKMSGWIQEQAFSQKIIDRALPKLRENLAVLLFYRGEDELMINVTNIPKGPNASGKTRKRSFIIIAKNIEEELTYPQEGGE